MKRKTAETENKFCLPFTFRKEKRMDEFRDRMKKLLEEALSEEYTVESREISDQNGKKRETLCVKRKEIHVV